jgi:hypothetical protein
MDLCVWRKTKSFVGLEDSNEVMAGTNFFPNWLGDIAIQDGDCCFPPTRPARSIRSHEDKTDGVDGRGKNRGKQARD